jgi:hypothetical protein
VPKNTGTRLYLKNRANELYLIIQAQYFTSKIEVKILARVLGPGLYLRDTNLYLIGTDIYLIATDPYFIGNELYLIGANLYLYF